MRRAFWLAVAAAALAAAPASSAPSGAGLGVLAFASNQSPWLSDHVFTAGVGGARLRVLGRGTKPVLSPDGKRVAFLRGHIGIPTGVWTMNRDGSHARAVARAGGGMQLADVPPSWSPDGTKLAYYILGPALEIVDLASGRTTAIPGAWAASWSPDARRIVYVDVGRYPQTLVVAAVDGSSHRMLVAQDSAAAPAWSPDGRWIAYGNSADGAPGLFLVRPDGTRRRRLTRDERGEGGLAWSPRGDRLAFVRAPSLHSGRGASLRVIDVVSGRYRDLVRSNAASPGVPVWRRDGRFIAFRSEARLYVVPTTGGRVHRLRLRSPAEAVSAAPAWLGGRTLLFSARLMRSDFELFTMLADGKHVRAVTNDSRDELDPAWSPDGRRLAFVRGRDRGALCTIGSDGRGARCLVNDGANFAPAWSPDGRSIVFVHDGALEVVPARGGIVRTLPVRLSVWPGGVSWSPDGMKLVVASAGSLYVVDVATGATTKLTAGGSDAQPAWSPDGRQIVFRSYRDARFFRDAQAWGLFDVDPARGEPSVHKLLTGVLRLRPSWAPDGTRIAFDDENAIYTASSAGTAVRPIKVGAEFSIRYEHAVWRP